MVAEIQLVDSNPSPQFSSKQHQPLSLLARPTEGGPIPWESGEPEGSRSEILGCPPYVAQIDWAVVWAFMLGYALYDLAGKRKPGEGAS